MTTRRLIAFGTPPKALLASKNGHLRPPLQSPSLEKPAQEETTTIHITIHGHQVTIDLRDSGYYHGGLNE